MVTERIILDDETNSELARQHFSRYVFAKNYVEGKRVLDIACGSGYGSHVLKESGALSVLGVDISMEALHYADQHYAGANVAFKMGNAEAIPADGPFDVIVSFETIEHLQRPELFLAESIRVLVKKGALIISTPIRTGGDLSQKPNNPFHVREWSVQEFTNLLGQYYERVEVYAQHNFKKNAIPYSRTMKRMFVKVFLPKMFETVNQFKVLSESPQYGLFEMEPVYMVVVCRKQ